MLDENDVVEAVCAYLPSQGYRVTEKRTTVEQGVDIVAVHQSGTTLLVEAKGATSSRPGSNRFGKPYTPSQLFDRTSKGFYTAAQLRSQNPSSLVALAFPAERLLQKHMQDVRSALYALHIDVLWVTDEGVRWEKADGR